MEDIVRQVAFHQHIAGEEFAFGVEFAAAPHFDDVFGRHQDFVEFIGQATLRRAFPDRFRDLLLEIGIGVDDIPTLDHEFFREKSG
jgi:hypothetical protein